MQRGCLLECWIRVIECIDLRQPIFQIKGATTKLGENKFFPWFTTSLLFSRNKFAPFFLFSIYFNALLLFVIRTLFSHHSQDIKRHQFFQSFSTDWSTLHYCFDYYEALLMKSILDIWIANTGIWSLNLLTQVFMSQLISLPYGSISHLLSSTTAGP